MEIKREDLCSPVYNYTQQNREHNDHDTKIQMIFQVTPGDTPYIEYTYGDVRHI